LAKGRTKGDKRQAIAKKDAQREIEREMGRQRKGNW
jgi:SsrA-binding protein